MTSQMPWQIAILKNYIEFEKVAISIEMGLKKIEGPLQEKIHF